MVRQNVCARFCKTRQAPVKASLKTTALLCTSAILFLASCGRLALGEMADALLLSSQRVLPAKFESLGYKFVLPDLESALRAVLAADSAKSS
jgi:NAD dependent epimerase/dehydratase family enzyme